jgi:hypothetical protein
MAQNGLESRFSLEGEATGDIGLIVDTIKTCPTCTGKEQCRRLD